MPYTCPPKQHEQMKHVIPTRQDERVLTFVRDDLQSKYGDLLAQGSYLVPAMMGNTEVFALETPGVIGHVRLPLTMDENTGLTVGEVSDWFNWHTLNLSPSEVAALHARVTADTEAAAELMEMLGQA